MKEGAFFNEEKANEFLHRTEFRKKEAIMDKRIIELQRIINDFERKNFPHGLKECEFCKQIPATEKEKDHYFCVKCLEKIVASQGEIIE